MFVYDVGISRAQLRVSCKIFHATNAAKHEFVHALADFYIDSILGSAGVYLQRVNSSTVKGCTFNGGTTGIVDAQSEGGNSYINDTFTNLSQPLDEEDTMISGLVITIGHYEFSGPPD